MGVLRIFLYTPQLSLPLGPLLLLAALEAQLMGRLNINFLLENKYEKLIYHQDNVSFQRSLPMTLIVLL